ncbi:MAG: hypothetical protein NUV59_02570 [Patescibacteria group bacterium]|nr:hypothetical protein [Patescibacteria group bacterium]
MVNIQEYSRKIKAAYEAAIGDWGLVAVVLLVGLISFGLGRFSALEDVRPPVAVQEMPSEMKPRGAYLGALLVASRSGRVYYFPWCTGAANIAPDNQIWFQSEKDARAAGYTPSKSCKGLE